MLVSDFVVLIPVVRLVLPPSIQSKHEIQLAKTLSRQLFFKEKYGWLKFSTVISQSPKTCYTTVKWYKLTSRMWKKDPVINYIERCDLHNRQIWRLTISWKHAPNFLFLTALGYMDRAVDLADSVPYLLWLRFITTCFITDISYQYC